MQKLHTKAVSNIYSFISELIFSYIQMFEIYLCLNQYFYLYNFSKNFHSTCRGISGTKISKTNFYSQQNTSNLLRINLIQVKY